MYDDYLRHMFLTLMIAINVVFREFIHIEKDKWETESTTTSYKLNNMARNNFNNMVAKN